MSDCPIQDGDNIPDWLGVLVYKAYVEQYGTGQSYGRIKERGGFGKAEVIWHLSNLGVKTRKDAQFLAV